MAWLYLILAALCEMSWPIGLKLSNNFTRIGPTLGTIVMMLLSFYFLALASHPQRGLHVGTAYAIWTGLGTTGVALIGMFFLGEPRDASRGVCIALIVAGVVGLKLFTPVRPDRSAGPAQAQQAGN